MNRAAACILLVAFLAAGCRLWSGPRAAKSRSVARGDGIWLADPAAAAEPGLEGELQRIGSVLLFLPAGEISRQTGGWVLRRDSAPPTAFQRVPVVLVVRAGPELAAALAAPGEQEGPAKAVAAGLLPAIATQAPYGTIAGVHLDIAWPPGSAPRYAALVSAVRRALPPSVFVSISMPSAAASDDERKALAPLVDAADALVAFVFGTERRTDATAIDSLRRPWWAAYATAGHGVLERGDGGARESVSDTYLNALSGNPRIEFENDLSIADASITGFHLIARGPVRVDGLALERGDRIVYRLPSLPDMLFQLGSTISGKRFILGRLIVLEGARDADRVYPIAVFEDVLLGRSLAPELVASVKPLGRNAISVGAENRSHHASLASRVSNWVEVDLAPAHLADVQLGGFDRYEVYDASGRPVTSGRATRVRLFETLVAPHEVIDSARIAVRGAIPPECCPTRMRLISAAGPEVATDWSSPPPKPTPTKMPAKSRRRK